LQTTLLCHRYGVKRKIIALLDQVFPEYEKLFSDTFGVTSMELLTKYQTPEQILKVDSQTLADLLQKAGRGRFGIDKANQIQEFAKNSFLQASVKLLPPLFFLKLVATFQSLNQYQNLLLLQDFIRNFRRQNLWVTSVINSFQSFSQSFVTMYLLKFHLDFS